MRQETWGPGGVSRGLRYRGGEGGHTKILDSNVAGSLHARVLRQDAQAVFDDALGSRIHDGNAVVIAHPSVARNDPLRLLDGRSSTDFNVGGELSDWLFARWMRSVHMHLNKNTVLKNHEGQNGERRTRRGNPQSHRRRHLDT